MYRVLVVDDSVTVRALFENLIAESEDFVLAGMLENAKAAPAFCARNDVDVVVMDVYTKNRENGLEAAALIKQDSPEIKVVISTSLPEASFIEKAKAAGCESFWYKEIEDVLFIDVLRRTMKGEHVYPSATPIVEIGMAKSVDFTPMEMKVLRELCEGKTNKAIAQTLIMSENTVKFHIANMLDKAGYSNKYQLAIDAVERKLIVPGF